MDMDILYWTIIVAMFIISFVGLIYPIIPSILFLVGGMLLYGVFYSFEAFSILFWALQLLLVAVIFAMDYAVNWFSVKKYGGSTYAVWGSIIGVIVGPFLIPFAGFIIGPFAGAFLGELIFRRMQVKQAWMAGVGTLVGFLGGGLIKFVIQALMIFYFYKTVF